MLFAFFAGVLSILSPCVLPLVPVVLAGAVAEHRLAPLGLAAGVAISFTAIGLFVATIGFSIGLDMSMFRSAAAVLLIALGAVLMVPAAPDTIRGRRRSGEQLDTKPFRRSLHLGDFRSVWGGTAARGRMDTVRRPYAWRRFDHGCSRREPREP